MAPARSMIAAILFVAACGTAKETAMSSESPGEAPRARVIQILTPADPADLGWAASLPHRQLADLPGALAALDAVARDASLDDTLRFKAFEARAALGAGFGDAAERRDAARVYLSALAAASWHDAWGYPDGSPAGAGKRVLALGREAVPGLLAALDLETRLQYEGSEEPTLAELRGYRVKDLVGGWLAALVGQRFDATPDDPSTRDAALAALAAAARAWID